MFATRSPGNGRLRLGLHCIQRGVLDLLYQASEGAHRGRNGSVWTGLVARALQQGWGAHNRMVQAQATQWHK